MDRRAASRLAHLPVSPLLSAPKETWDDDTSSTAQHIHLFLAYSDSGMRRARHGIKVAARISDVPLAFGQFHALFCICRAYILGQPMEIPRRLTGSCWRMLRRAYGAEEADMYVIYILRRVLVHV
ncbi:hypothetical protein BD310DRAFT_932754 [Dichomitus squalens]|uniref:Uncharacterized protein n=1 Tax=Dichomitus squalens TaxID=114155 RepID=A0A4Q9PNN9_9APHY|nr:hypothetical protein BD310DRAFT_932754 [Dichomitus squalens]